MEGVQYHPRRLSEDKETERLRKYRSTMAFKAAQAKQAKVDNLLKQAERQQKLLHAHTRRLKRDMNLLYARSALCDGRKKAYEYYIAQACEYNGKPLTNKMINSTRYPDEGFNKDGNNYLP